MHNCNTEEHGPLEWIYVTNGTEICGNPVSLMRNSVCSNNSEVRKYISCYVKRYHTIIDQSDID